MVWFFAIVVVLALALGLECFVSKTTVCDWHRTFNQNYLAFLPGWAALRGFG